MRVGVLIPFLSPANGLSQHFIALLQGFRRVRHDQVEVYVLMEDSPRNASKEIPREIEPVWFSPGEEMATIESLSLDLLHSPSFMTPLKLSIPTMVTIHDTMLARNPDEVDSLLTTIRWNLTKQSAFRANRVVAISETAKAAIIQDIGVPESKIDMILNSVREECYSSGMPHRMLASVIGSRQVAIYCGGRMRRKNVGRMIKAFNQLDVRGPESPLLVMVNMLDNGAPCDELQGFLDDISWGLVTDSSSTVVRTSKLVLTDAISTQELVWLYRRSSVLLSPSLDEGFGLPVAEALSIGCPIIASDIPSHRELTKGNATLLDPLSPIAWTEKITEIFASQMPLNANEHETLALRAAFRPERMVGQLLEAYLRAIHT